MLNINDTLKLIREYNNEKNDYNTSYNRKLFLLDSIAGMVRICKQAIKDQYKGYLPLSMIKQYSDIMYLF